jgi:hypothetical protein
MKIFLIIFNCHKNASAQEKYNAGKLKAQQKKIK